MPAPKPPLPGDSADRALGGLERRDPGVPVAPDVPVRPVAPVAPVVSVAPVVPVAPAATAPPVVPVASVVSVAPVVPEWPAPSGVRAYTTSRPGGVSEGAYASLNLAGHVGDDPARVTENRRRLAAGLALPSEPVWLDQVHGTRVLDLDVETASEPADGAVTSRPGTVCAVLTADCVPVLLADRRGGRVGVAHAGWRGLVAGVLPGAVAALGSPAAEVLAWLGPAIGQPAFEVGDEVRAAFEAAGFECGAAFTANARGRWQADLHALATQSLRSAGVAAVYRTGACTYREPDRFFSHRREAPCGRFATLIWIE